MATTTPYPAPDIAAAVARGLAAARDRPQPDLDGNRSAQKYAGMARDFRVSTWEHLNKGDLPQASNKAWGLVAETVKAISAHYGSIIHSHRAIVAVIERLARLADAGDGTTRRRINDSFKLPGICTPTFTKMNCRRTRSGTALSRARHSPGGFTCCFGPSGLRRMGTSSNAGV